MQALTILLLGSLVLHPARDLVEVETTHDRVVLTFQFPSPLLKEVDRAKETFLEISVGECARSGSVGRPLLPVRKELVEIPHGVTPTVRTDVVWEEELSIAHPILPAQPPVLKSSSIPPEFVFDREFYHARTWTPREIAAIEEVAIMRRHRVVSLKVSPVQYLPGEGKMRVVRRLRVVIDLTPEPVATSRGVAQRYLTRHSEETMAATVCNFQRQAFSDGAIGYLIITRDALAPELMPLVEWKRTKGFHTTLVPLSEISAVPTKEEIKGYIQQAYEAWQIPPYYVLLVGDANDIPAWYGDSSGYPTDLYYSTVDGDDIFPDVRLGRLSVATLNETNSSVEKIIHYEQNEWSSGDEWLDRAYFIASRDAAYHQIAESTHAYCTRLARQNGMVCDSLWTYYQTGTPIDDAFNSGRGMVTYSGHGSAGGWVDPRFWSPDAESLQNLDKYPLVLSYACLTGNYTSHCFGEVLTRGSDNGALAFLGSSAPSYWDQDDIFQRYLFDALFIHGFSALGDIIEYGKFGLANLDDSLSAYYYEVYNLLGDPSLDIYTDSPHPIVVDHPDLIPSGSYSLEVQVQDSKKPVYNAFVSCLTDTISTAFTDSTGIAMVQLQTSPGDTVWVTVTGHNLRPHRSYALSAPTGVPERPRELSQFAPLGNDPNPFRDETRIRYYVPYRGAVSLQIYDSSGRLVRRERWTRAPGYHSFVWDGTDSNSSTLSSGIYLCRLEISGISLTKKMILLK